MIVIYLWKFHIKIMYISKSLNLKGKIEGLNFFVLGKIGIYMKYGLIKIPIVYREIKRISL